MEKYSEHDIRAIVADEIRKLFANGFGNLFNLNQSQDIEWMPTKEAAKRLNYPSQDSLRKDIDNGSNDGNLRLGYEVQDRRKRNSKKPDYYFNCKRCVERLNTAPEKRSA